MQNNHQEKLAMWWSRPILAILFMSFSSSLPLVLVGSTLQAWYTVAGVDLLTIGMLTLIGQPYVYKFLWAPLMDRFSLFSFDRRRGWILLTQVALVVGLATMAYLDPKTDPWLLATVAMAVAFVSASQDIAIDAYRVDVLTERMRSAGAAVTNLGGRLAILVGGAFALVIAAEIGWRATYLLMAGFIFMEIIITLTSPKTPTVLNQPQTLSDAIWQPVKNIFSRQHAIAIIIFIVLYKLSDAFAFALNTTFLIRGVGFSLEEVGLIYKIVSLVALLLGSFVGGVLMQRIGLYRALLYFGVLQVVSNLTYMFLALVGKSYLIMILSVFTEYFCSGLGTVAFIVFLMSLCDKRFSAAQYAIFSALMAIGRVFAGPEVAVMVEHLGWAGFYFVTFLMGWPAIFLLLWLRARVDFMLQPVVVSE
ncbi:MAG: MFS transporter [Coxiella sp. RIFCSPHIGHO2_12_FULL_42_15]|nr:MAG: MFS transporter [Coxiella sp. RIFCSPHIGHO2_12_FULL_42_15]